MSIYVDGLKPAVKSENWPYGHACHLVADIGHEPELHRFAEKMKLKREWYQPLPIPHYDLTPNKRLQAIRLGAGELNNRELMDLVNQWRAQAQQWFRANGDTLCDVCGREYSEHTNLPNGFVRLCNGSVAKL